MVREALFNILGEAVGDRPFIDVFAGSGVVGLEAVSRGASSTMFIERDNRLAQEIEQHIRELGLEQTRVARVDAYRWAESWEIPGEPVTIFVSPPFGDIERRTENLLGLLRTLAEKSPVGSIVVLQSERHSALDGHPALAEWDERHYGRNTLLLYRRRPEGETPA
jgi:16S rRNA (guanine(966)-N(2))-methyltransferase RsmD